MTLSLSVLSIPTFCASSGQIPFGATKLSHPGMAIAVADTVAQLQGVPLGRVLEQCLVNTRACYRLDAVPGSLQLFDN